MQTELLGDAISLSRGDHTLIIASEHATVRVMIYGPSVIRIHISRHPGKEDHSFAVIRQAEGTLNFTETTDAIEVTTTDLRLTITRSPLRCAFFTKDGLPLSEDDPRFGTTWQGNRVTTFRKLQEGERFMGLGEKTGNLDRRGSHYVNWNTDAPNHTPETDPLYKTFPFFIGAHSGRTYGLFFDNPGRSFFDFGASTDEQMTWFGADDGDMNYYFFGAQSVAGIISDYTWLTGRMEMPPYWSLGYQQCRWSYMSAAEVVDVARTFRERNIPADAMYCDIDYMDNYKIFTWNPETFPDPKAMIDALKALHFQLVTIVDPGIKIEDGYRQYEEGVAGDYFATYPNGEKFIGSVWPGRCHFPDFFREDVRLWWGRSFAALTEPGVQGFWNDMNEPAAWGQNIPWIVQFGNYTIPEVRNVYGLEMARATYEGTKALLGNKRPFVLTRAAYSGVQRFSAVWTGDNTANDEHLLLGQRLVNSLGLAGVSYTGVDIGGFMGDPSPELMVRWNSLGPYIPMFRNHAALGTRNREPWVWGQVHENTIRKDIEQRYRLLPYIYSCFYLSHKTGIPVSRTLAIDYTHEPAIYEPAFQNQFLFGPYILVAPLESTKTEATVFLPTGQWYRLSTDEKFDGDEVVTVPAPLTDLPVFVRAGSIIPMQQVVQHTAEAGDGILQLHIWLGNDPSQFQYYEDDGSTYDYQNGACYLRLLRFDPAKRAVVLDQPEGRYLSRYDQLRLVFHGFGDQLQSVYVNGTKMKAGYDIATRTSFLQIPNTPSQIGIIY